MLRQWTKAERKDRVLWYLDVLNSCSWARQWTLKLRLRAAEEATRVEEDLLRRWRPTFAQKIVMLAAKGIFEAISK